MRFKKYILLLFVFLASLGMISCSSEKAEGSNNPSSSSESKQEENTIFEEGFLSLNVTYTSTTLETKEVEDTIEAIYDSVVSIDAYMNQQLYGSGSGVLFGYDERFSYIATCHHVIENCQTFKVLLSNEDSYEAKLVGGDAQSDIAVLSIEKTELTYASWFEDTSNLRLGASVICIGNPLGTLPGSVSTGVISYPNREVQVDDYQTMELIQTDVAINSGNSGGGLFNAAGALIGIVNAKYSSSGIEGLGFAIPANQVIKIIDSILKSAKYNMEDNCWQTGYVDGRWHLGFILGYDGMFIRSAIGIADIATNETSSDFGLLQKNDKLNAITIAYKDISKDNLTLSNINAQSMKVEDVYKFIYSASCELGDNIILDLTRNNENIIIHIELIQYIYSI